METGVYGVNLINDNGNSFMIIPDEIIKELGWLENDKLNIDITEVSFDEYEGKGILIYPLPGSGSEPENK